MFTFINITGVMGLHLDSLKNFRTKRMDMANIFLFILLPLLAGMAPAITGHRITVVETVTISLFMSIGGAAMFSIMATIPTLFKGDGPHRHMVNLRRTLILEVRASLAFCALVALGTIVVLLTSLVDPLKYAAVGAVYFIATGYALTALDDLVNKHKSGEIRHKAVIKVGLVLIIILTGAAVLLSDLDTTLFRIISGLTYFLTATFVVNMIVVIKRLHILVDKETEEPTDYSD